MSLTSLPASLKHIPATTVQPVLHRHACVWLSSHGLQTRTWKVLWQATTPLHRSYRWSSVLFDTLRRLSQIEIDFHCWWCERLAYCLFETSTSWKGLTTQTPLLKCSLNVMNLGGGGWRKKRSLIYSAAAAIFSTWMKDTRRVFFFLPGSSVIFILTQIEPRLHLGFPARQTFAWIYHFPFWQWHSRRCFRNTRLLSLEAPLLPWFYVTV